MDWAQWRCDHRTAFWGAYVVLKVWVAAAVTLVALRAFGVI